MTLYEDLMYRGLIKDVASEDLKKVLDGDPISFYWGTDPTADSLHIGHYSSLITAKRLAKAGHHPVLLVGGATGLIGDPRPTAEREIISKEVVENNYLGIKNQVSHIFGGNVDIVNNYDWFKDISWIDFLRDTGKYININYMLDKDIIRRRLDTGITFAEFAYTLMQGYDYLYLYENKNVTLECAGSDQWGNITTGVDLISKKLGKQVNAFTMPLILDANGNKFGKSEGNALWLDINKTSAYEIYQYLINTADSKVEEYLKVFTFLTKEEIEDTMAKHNAAPEKRIAQQTLAREFITDLHGKEEYEKALKISEALFSGNIKELSLSEIESCFKGVPSFEAKEETLIDMLVNNSIASSRREAREFLTAGSITLNGDKVTDENMLITSNLAIEGKVIVIRKGKKKYYVGKF
ncbi:MAG: tyrosine--tRNA ligase [Bacilli bacterium]|nr:tyrosine--tRNA ligase [Bacilli bacterium]